MFFSVFDTFAHIKLCLFCTKLGTQHYLVSTIVLKWLEKKIIVKCLILRVKLRFYRFLSVFGTFAHKVTQNWFILHETWHATLYGIYYCVEVFRDKNHSHMIEIMCYAAILWVFKCFWYFRT